MGLNRIQWMVLLVVLMFCELGGNVALAAAPQSEANYEQQRIKMVEVAVKGAGVTDERVLGSMLAKRRT